MAKNRINYNMTPEEKEAKIIELSYRSNDISLSLKNRKLGPAVVSLPMPVTVCDPNLPCAKECYAKHGCQSFANVQSAYYRNLRLYQEDPDKFFENLWHKLEAFGLNKVRLFDAGDYPSYDFLIRTVQLAKKCPNIKFMTYTKKYAYVNQYLSEGGKLPDNYQIFFSAWDKDYIVPNPYNLPMAFVDFADKTRNPNFTEGSFVCPGKASNCSKCGACWNKNIKGVIFGQH